MTGVFAGMILKSASLQSVKKIASLVFIGLVLVAAGWLWGLQMPVIKKLWTSSMVLVSSGYCFLLMALFYWLIDCRGYGRYAGWLKVYGMNSIVAYMLVCCVNFSSVGRSLLYGLEQYVGDYYPVCIAVSNAAIIYVILLFMYRNKIFLKV